MLKEAIEKILEIGSPQYFHHDEGVFSDKQLYPVLPLAPEPVMTSSLTSLVDFVVAECDSANTIICVDSPTKVSVRSMLLPKHNQRYTYMIAEAVTPLIPFGKKWMDPEEFIIMLKTCFLENNDLANVLRIVGNIKEEAVKTSVDDGVTQTVVARSGIAKVEEVEVNPIVRLQPFRTFQEIDQPCGLFLLRIRKGPECALFEADGGAWRMRAIRMIKEWLSAREELGGYVILG